MGLQQRKRLIESLNRFRFTTAVGMGPHNGPPEPAFHLLKFRRNLIKAEGFRRGDHVCPRWLAGRPTSPEIVHHLVDYGFGHLVLGQIQVELTKTVNAVRQTITSDGVLLCQPYCQGGYV